MFKNAFSNIVAALITMVGMLSERKTLAGAKGQVELQDTLALWKREKDNPSYNALLKIVAAEEKIANFPLFKKFVDCSFESISRYFVLVDLAAMIKSSE
ncbi:MAG TPA: hypothetical protein VIY47_03125 [Ignavibacteriaceae bacterium]